MKKIILSFWMITMLYSMSNGQSITLEDVAGKTFNGVYPITSAIDGTVSGYYTYYKREKGKKGMNTYQFAFIDRDVTLKITTDLELHNSVELNVTVFNGKYLLVSYEDWKNKLNVFKLIDNTGKIIKTKEIAIDKKTYRSSTVFPAENGTGFYFITTEDPKKAGVGYEIQKLDNNLTTVWTQLEQTPKGGKSIADLVSSHGKIILWQEYNLKGEIKPSIICLDATTGKKVFERDGFDGQSTILNNQIRVSPNGEIILGGAYVNGEKMDYINSDGIYILKISPEGKDLLYTKVPNKEKIQPALKAAASGIALGSKDKVYVEDLIVNGDEIVVVTEMFRKNINVTPAPIQVTRDLITGKWIGYLGGYNNDDSKVVFEIMDFMMFRFDNKGTLTDIKQIEKEESNKITVWAPYTGYWGMALAQVMERAGWFDYGFTTENNKGEKIMVCMNNATPRIPEVNTYSLDNRYAKTKINLKQEAKINLEEAKVGYFKVMNSSKGKIAVAYYQRKLDRITINLESLDK